MHRLLALLVVMGCASTHPPRPTSSSSSSPRSADAPPACTNVRAIDWANATLVRGAAAPRLVDEQLPADAELRSIASGPIRFERGTHRWYADPDQIEVGEHFELVRVDPDDERSAVRILHGDLDGDGCDEAVLHVIDRSWGTNRSTHHLWIMRAARSGTVTIAGTVPGFDGYCLGFHDIAATDGYGAAFEGVALRDGALWTTRVTQRGDRADEHAPATCTPSEGGIRIQRWIWQGGRIAEDVSARRSLAPSP